MLVAMRGLEPVFLDPVADRRFMQIEAPADLRQRQARRNDRAGPRRPKTYPSLSPVCSSTCP
jgi:hypothetical protein